MNAKDFMKTISTAVENFTNETNAVEVGINFYDNYFELFAEAYDNEGNEYIAIQEWDYDRDTHTYEPCSIQKRY